jgi:hypothetical protein
MSMTIEQLRKATDDELIERHDEMTVHTSVGVSFYLDELKRRETQRAMESSNRLARASFYLTIANTVLALVAVVVALSA